MAPVVLLWFVFLPFISLVLPVQAHAADSTGYRALADQTVGGYLKSYLARLERQDAASAPARLEIDGQLKRFYLAMDYRPAWTNRQAIARLVEVIEESTADGLTPSDYHLEEIRSFAGNLPESPALKARADLLMTDAVFTLMWHLRTGKVSPRSLDANWNIALPKSPQDYDQTLMMAVMGSKFPEMIAALRNASSEYVTLRKALRLYRKIAENGGWETVTWGPQITRVGEADPRIPLIQKRLILTGDLLHDTAILKSVRSSADSVRSASPASIPSHFAASDIIYTQDIYDAVSAFQRRHGLSVDGVISNETLGAMNMPVAERINQIRVNLERERWHSSTLGSSYVMVNIPAFSVVYVQDKEVRWKSRVIVGKPDLQTPVFGAQIQSVILNPRWVIPPGILVKEAIPAIRKSIGYLSRHQLTVVDSNGKPVDPAQVSWSQYSGGGAFPYRLVQASGDAGSLGRIKFNMPNRFTVYMHDTPTKPLFERSRRAYSHGCVRVDRPFELAEYLLRDSVKWSLPKIETAINTGKTRTVPLPVKVPVYFFYQTVFTEGDNIVFRNDVYDRDKELLDALNSDKVARSVEEALRP
jgi:murein L,D-transpeptidase YcbB/YkuD